MATASTGAPDPDPGYKTQEVAAVPEGGTQRCPCFWSQQCRRPDTDPGCWFKSPERAARR